jgi:HD superfamily phosphodiesterase
MKLVPLALLAVLATLPLASFGQDQAVSADEQILLKQVQTDKRTVYANAMQLTDSESAAFWKVYDEYEAATKKLDDRFLQLVNDYAANYDTLTDEKAMKMLKEKLAIERERMALKQKYTMKIAKVVPAKQALRYAQVETRVDNLLRRNVYSLIPLAR